MAAAATTTVERMLAPLDGARRSLLQRLARWNVARPIVVSRDRRIRAQALIGVTASFALTLRAPGLLFMAGPALFGVAHVASDVRYLVLRRDLPRWWIRALTAGCVGLLALRGLEAAFPGAAPFAAIEVAAGWGLALCGIGAATVLSPAARGRGIAALALVFPLGLAAIARPALARVVFAHAHNLIAVGLWLLLFRRALRFAAPAVAALVIVTAACVTGRLLPWVHLDGPGAARFAEEMVLGWPAGMPQRTALGLGLAFVFLQSIHYSVWLSLIPQEDRRGQGTSSFRMTFRTLLRDLHPVWLCVTIGLALAVAAASLVDPHRTRQLYMSLASFHGYLELAAAAFLFVRGA